MMERLSVDNVALRGTTVIEASAGTGKTYTITSLFLRLLLEGALTVDQILVVTYTRAATAELRDRIRKRLAEALACARQPSSDDDPFLRALCARASERSSPDQVVRTLERALSDIDQAPVLTIHSFCQRVLRDHAFESGSGFSIELTAHSAPIIDEIADDYFTAQLFDTDPLRAQLLCNEADTLRALAQRVGAGDNVRIVPELSDVPSLSSAFAQWKEAQRVCRELWQQESGRVRQAVLNLKGVSAKNVGSWCEQLEELLDKGKAGFSAGKFATGFGYFTRTIASSKLKPGAVLPPFFDAAEQLLEEDKRYVAATIYEKAAFRAGFVRYLQAQLAARAQRTSVRTFDALLSELAAALQGEHAQQLLAALRRKYRAGLVDEFQDTDPAQYAMFKRIFAEGGHALFLIGDPKQAIYAFRGADVQAYLAARRDAGGQVFTLDVNRRSDEALVNALNGLYARVRTPFLSDEIAYIPVSTPSDARDRFSPRDGRAPIDLALIASASEDQRQIARKVALDIATLLASGARRIETGHGTRHERALIASDIAVLCRTNQQAYEVQAALSELSVPGVLSGDASVFDSEDAGHMERALTALAHPADARALRSFLCSIYGGCSAEQLLDLERDDTKWDEHARNFRELSELFITRGFTQALRALCTFYKVEERLLARPDGLRRITNLQHLGELLSEISLSERLGPLGLLRWLECARSDAVARAELVGDSHELRLESGDNAVKLTTVHKSKGLEYPVVYCPFLFKPQTLRSEEKELVRFHDESAHGALTLDVGSERRTENREQAEQEVMAEALRLLYVALTRAKHRICLVLPAEKPAARAALMYTLFGGGDVGELETRLKAMAGGEQAELGSLCAASQGGMSLRWLHADPDARTKLAAMEATRAPVTQLEVRAIKRQVDSSTRTASFSALIAGRQITHEVEGDEPSEHSADSSQVPSPLTLEPFPRGAAPGRLLHEILEHIPFDATPQQWRPIVERTLRAHAYDLALTDVLLRGLEELLGTPLDGLQLALHRIARNARVDELEFLFPVTNTLTARSLAKVFRAHDAPSVQPAYVKRLELLPFDALRGYLRGFIDLVFTHEGRFFVVDYKSNHLGPLASDYEQPALLTAMSEHHYYLQYHLYTLALHRYLTQRLPDYDYDRHFGGVYYLFARGIAPWHPQGTGIFYERPSRALIDALDRAMRSASDEQTEVA